MVLSDSCVYTIVTIDELDRAVANGTPLKRRENSRWVTADRLLARAQKDLVAFPVLLADAKDCTELLYWGVLTDLELGGDYSEFTLDRLRPIGGKHTPQELVLLSSGRTIAPEYIRPYALCATPGFITTLALHE